MRRAIVALVCGLLTTGASQPAGSAEEAAGPSSGGPRARPTPEQVAWQDMELEMFVCIDPCTWQDREYDDHSTPLGKIDPRDLDTDQWVRVARSFGAGQVLFVAKHTGGFCWWQTETSDYGVRQIPWRGGKGDVVADLSESCRKAGIRLAIYLSPADDVHGAAVGGRCKTPEAQEAYGRTYRRQLEELLGRYGPVSEVWFDGSLVVDVSDILERHAPKAMVFQGPHATIRWVGNEEGVAPYPAWNSVSLADARSGVATAQHGRPDGDVWLPLEVDTVNVVPHAWFWNAKPGRRLRTVDELMDCYYRSVGHGGVLLLNQTPDTTGLIPEADARRAAEFGEEIRRRFGSPVAETSGSGGTVVLRFREPAIVDHVVILEDIRDGERILEYRIEALAAGDAYGAAGTWAEVCAGSSVGHKKIDRFAPVEASAVRLACLRTQGEPRIRRLAAYRASSEPPSPPLADSTWSLDAIEGGLARDSEGKRTGRVGGASAVEGIRGGALLLDGRRGFVGLGDLEVGGGDFTIEAWICLRSVAAREMVIAGKERSGVGPDQLRFYVGPGNRLGFMMSDSAGNHIWPFETAEGAVPARRWSHVAVTRRGAEFTLLVNGEKVGTKSSPAAVRHRNDLEMRLGARFAPSGDAPDLLFDGAIDEVRILGRALSAEELAPPADLLEAARTAVSFPSARRRPEELARPTPEQAAWQDLEVGMFIHFAPNTWQDREGDDLSTPLERIDPRDLDADQWVSVAQSLGAGYIVFVAKHVGGFCWWQTETTDYSVRGIPWRGGKGDVLRDLSESCRRRGMKLGVYLSPADAKHGAGVGGRCADADAQDRYAAIYRTQLTEVLSRYGEMCEVWFDGSLVVEVGDILRRHAPRAMVFQGKHATIRWVGNEEGVAPYPAWNAVLSTRDPERWGVHTAADGDPYGDRWLPNECDARIRRDWFWSTGNAGTLKTVEQLLEMYYGSVGRGAVLLLNNTPDVTGLIPEADARRSAEFGAEVRRRFGTPIAEASGRGAEVELRLEKPAVIDHAVAMEDIREGERVLEYVIEAVIAGPPAAGPGPWQEICRGSSVGHKRIDRFAPAEVSRVRWRAVDSMAEPIVRRFAVYRVGAEAPAGREAAEAGSASLGEWTPDSIRGETAVLELDLVPHVKRATQYEVTFRKTGGTGDIAIEKVVLLHDGVEAPQFVSEIGPGAYNVNITGLGRAMVLRVTLKRTGAWGEATIRERTPR